MRDEIYKEPLLKPEKFEFSEKVAGVFDDMISRSVPYYNANQFMTAEMAADFYIENTMIYDLGCSIGKTAHFLSAAFDAKRFIYTGIDNSPAMIDKAKTSFQELPPGFPQNQKIEFVSGDIENYHYQKSSVIIANYTFQFISPEKRLPLLKNLYTALYPRGILLISEKVTEKDETISDLFSKLHHKMKKSHGYSDLEIIQKRDALENVLIPNTAEKNIELLNEAGFQSVSIYHKWYNFASYIALKK